MKSLAWLRCWRPLLSLLLSCMLVPAAWATTVSANPTSCTSVSGSGSGTRAWSDPSRAISSNNSRARVSVDGTTSYWLKCVSYGFAIPSGATITGVRVNVERKSSSTDNGGSRDAGMRLVKAGVIGATDRATATIYTTSDVTETHGTATDLWGDSWTPADINNANFGAAFMTTKPSSSGSAQTVGVDVITILVDYIADTTPPVVSSIVRAGFNPNGGSTVSWTVTFSESVTGVDTGDFSLVQAGGVSGASIASVVGGLGTWTVTANTGSGSGTLGLNLVDNDSIIDTSGNRLGGTGAGNGNLAGQVYTIDKANPSVTLISLANPNPTNAASLSWTVNFSESVTGVDAGDFSLVQAGGVSGASITTVTGAGALWTVSANSGFGSGTLGLNLVDNDSITDALGNRLGGTGAGNGNATGAAYTIDRTPPSVLSIARLDANPTTQNQVSWQVTFSESVSGVDLADFNLVASGVSGAYLVGASGSGTTYTITANTGVGAGTLGLNLVDNDSITDALSNKLGGTGAGNGNYSGEVYTISDTPPVAGYKMDENKWTGATGEVADETGNFPGTARNSATTAMSTPAIPGTPGTCAYGVFDNTSPINTGYVELDADFPHFGDDFTVAAWIRTTDNSKSQQYIFFDNVGSQGFFVSLGDAGAGRLRFRAEGASTKNFDAPMVLANNTWYFIAATADFSGDPDVVRTLHVFNSSGALVGSASQTNTGWTTDTGVVTIGGNASATSSSNHFRGNIDEVRVYDKVLSQSALAALALTTRPCVFIDHIAIEHNGSGVTCVPTTLTIKACADATCSSLYSGGVTGTLTATGTPTVNWVGGAVFAIGAFGWISKDVQVTTAGNVTWGASGVAPVATNGTTCYIGATNSCSFTSNLAGFLFDVPNHASDTSQTITVSAVKQADNSLVCTPAFIGAKTINFGCAYSNPATGTLPVVVGGSNITCGSTGGIALTFNASGVASTTVRYADVGQMSLTASYTGSGGSETGLVMTGSDTFIAAPASFAVTPAGPYVAGNNFSVTVAAKNASGNTTPNFGKESSTENVTLGHTLTGPAGGNDPALSGTTTMPDASFQTGNGTATVSDIKWAEVGDISITATLASASYLGSGLTASGSAAAGAFKPAYFDTVVTPGTGSLTYSGQPFAVQVTAKNASGGTTLNYKGAYAKAVTLTDGNSGTNNSATLGVFSNASIAAASFINGVATNSTISYRFNTKTTAPLETPTSAPLKLRATDTDSVTSSGHTEGTTPIRAGRLRLVNFYGSDLLKPRVEYRAEYWDGSRWATNTLDSSTPIVAGNIATGGLAVNSLTGLTSGIGFITFNTAAAGSYDIALDLNAAGVDTSCNAAHAGAPANKPWLQGYWSAPANCGGVAAWGQDPNARIRLGSPRAPYIYLRERY